MAHNFLSELTGSFAMPAAENPTVAMVEAAYRHHKLDWRYINCEVTPANLRDAVAAPQAMNWAGLNCSLPHKVAVIEHLDGLGESARIMGAVNCAVRRGSSYRSGPPRQSQFQPRSGPRSSRGRSSKVRSSRNG
jgi:shikimate dehydrogenase